MGLTGFAQKWGLTSLNDRARVLAFGWPEGLDASSAGRPRLMTHVARGRLALFTAHEQRRQTWLKVANDRKIAREVNHGRVLQRMATESGRGDAGDGVLVHGGVGQRSLCQTDHVTLLRKLPQSLRFKSNYGDSALVWAWESSKMGQKLS